LNKKITPYIYIVFFFCFSGGIFCQDLTLKLIGKDSIETSILNEISYQKNHLNKEAVLKEISTIHEKLKRIGFFTSFIKSVKDSANLYKAEFYLGKKTSEIIIKLPENLKSSNYDLTSNDSIIIRTEELDNFINAIISELDQKGASFSEVTLENPEYKNDILYVFLKVNQSTNRKINNVLIKQYEDFPHSFVKNFFKVKKNTIFSKKKLQDISTLTKGLTFIEEIKPPEVLFKKDSTILYLFLKKVKANSIDGIVNFASKENGSGILLNGNLDLKLNNILNTGENFELFWNRIGEEKSEFRLSTKLPYLFNTSISSKLSFNIYRQDSTFLNTSFLLDFDYQLNSKSNLSISYTSEKSNYLLDPSIDNFDSYSNSFIGLGYHFILRGESPLFKKQFSFNISPTFGNRKTNSTKENQLKILFSAFANFNISKKSYLSIKNETALLESDNFLINELFRIGGANNIRGFNEQSIFTNRYSYLNIEYRFLTSSSSYLHSITDIGFYKDTFLNKTSNAIGLGIGYLFKLNNNQINLGYAIGINSNNDVDLNNSQLIIKWASFF
jgi:hypothetical protein